MKLIRIGRSDFNEARLDDPTVSRRHAEMVVLADGRLFLTDCMSTGGTHVSLNGQWSPIRQAFVEPGDQIRFGNVATTASSIATRN